MQSIHDIDTAPYGRVEELTCPTCGEAFCAQCATCPDDGTELIEPIGELVDGRYRIMRVLGEGAMGVVYEAVQLSLKRPVALKVIRDELGRDPIVRQRFLREARLLTCISHPNIVEVFDHGELADGSLYLVMELLRGNSLDAIVEAHGTFSISRVRHIALQLCDALTAAHAQGIVHRDLKPSNIVVLAGPTDHVKIVDFGLAKLAAASPDDELTEVGALLGTPMYMAPEAARSEPLDARSDLYSLGCILYELAAGWPAFAGDCSAMVLSRQVTDDPPPLPPRVPASLAGLISWLLAKHPDDRPGSVSDVRDWLNR